MNRKMRLIDAEDTIDMAKRLANLGQLTEDQLMAVEYVVKSMRSIVEPITSIDDAIKKLVKEAIYEHKNEGYPDLYKPQGSNW